MRRFLYALLGCLIFAPLNAQKNQVTPKQPPKNWTHFDSAQQISATQLAQDKSALQLGADDDLQLLSTKNDDLGYRHYRYQQTYKGIPIEGAIYLIHEKNNRTKKANGKLISNINIHTVSHVSEVLALQAALQYVGADVYAWEDATHQALIQQVEQCEDATFYPSGDLVIIDPEFGQNPDNCRLAYKFDVYAIAPLSRQVVYVDAQNSTVLKSIERLHSCTDTPASGNSNYSGTVNFTACQENGTHTLKNHLDGVIQQVFNANNTLTNPEIPFTDSDGFFEADPTAVDVHFATQKTHEYFLNNHNRNSLDGNGTPLYSWIHYGNGYNNASWNGSWMIYGDGDNDKYSALTAPDVVAHEMTHGITEFAANNLIYSYESGALNESFSDIFGEVVEAYIRGEGNNDWIIGADFTVRPGKNGIRNMSNPNDASVLTRQPDTYLGEYWHTGAGDNGGVHFNSGVQNYWFYLLSEGGSGINDNGDDYDIAGIGMNKATAIAYRNLTTYMTSASQYTDAREGAIQAAIDLYGADSEEVLQTKAAWCAVGVGNCNETPPPPVGCDRERDSLALVALYNSTDGANWTTTWDLTQAMDTWQGVNTNFEGCVSRLTLDQNNLAGQLPAEIGDLSRMERLILNNNPLTGPIPPEIGNASNLEWLWIYSTQVSGPIPVEIGNLTNLAHLSLNDNELNGNLPHEIGNLSNLTNLRISNNLLNGQIPAEIGNLDQLTNLNLGVNQFTGTIPPAIGNLSQLTTLTLNYNQLSGSIPAEIGNASQLGTLQLNNNHLTGNLPSELANLTNLWFLQIYGNQLSGCYDEGLTSLCTQISSAFNTNIQISNGNNFDAPWEDFCATGAGSCTPPSELPCRERDSLALIALYDATNGANWINTWDLAQPMDAWYGVTLNVDGCVELLSLIENELNGSIPAEIGNLNNLESLSLHSNQLSGNIPSEIGNLTNLEMLNLHTNELDGSIPVEIGNLLNLVSLHLYENQLDGNIPPQIGSLTNLVNLYLLDNQLSGSIPAEIGNLNNLEKLNLSSNQLSGNIPPEIGNLTNLKRLVLHHNQLSGSIPPEIGNLNNLERLVIHANQLNGCYDNALVNLCSQVDDDNATISNGNNFDASWEDFCATGAGTCAPVWPGDFNNDGIANNIDAIFWGLAAGNTGAIRPDATTNWQAQTAPEWSQSIIGINGKHQDADGNGIVDVNDLNVLVDNYGLTHDTLTPAGASSPLQFELRQLGTEIQNGLHALRYGVYLNSSLGVPINVHGLAFSLDLSGLPVMEYPQIDNVGSALAPTASIVSPPPHNKTHIALTRTDKNNQLIIDGDLITQFIIIVKDVQSGDPFRIRIENGNIGSANGTINAVNGTSLYNLFNNGIDVPLSTSVSVVHEQCYTLGSASVSVLEGTPPYTYSWSTGANTAEVTHLPAGTYTVEIYDANGQQQSIPIQIDAPAPIYDEVGNEIDCSPQSAWLMPQLYAMLEGPYDANTGMMTNQLQALNFLPDIQPYQAFPWNYRGTEGQDWTAADYPDGTVDWVLVSFRDVQNVDRVYAKTAALLHQDGSLSFPHKKFLSAEVTDSVHVVIQHRNHIAAMTPEPLSIDNQTIIHDFSLGDSYHPPSQYGQKQLPDGTWVMFAGDCEQSGVGYDINGDDKGLWIIDNGIFANYLPTDLNLDGDVNGADKGLWFENNGINSVAPK